MERFKNPRKKTGVCKKIIFHLLHKMIVKITHVIYIYICIFIHIHCISMDRERGNPGKIVQPA